MCGYRGTNFARWGRAKSAGALHGGVTFCSVIQPTGPLSPEVYWRRRVLALAGVVVVLLLLIWLVAALVDRPAERPVQPAAQQIDTTSEPASPPTVPVAASSGQRLQPFDDLRPASSPPAGSGAAPPAPAAVSPVAPPAAPPAPPGPPQPCPDATTVITAAPGRAEYRVGSKPVFTLSVTNTGPAACTRDLDARLQELLVFAADGTTRLWSSNDCYPGDSVDVRVLQPGETVSFKVTWAGRSSSPGCVVKRETIQAGDYYVVAKLGPLAGAPTSFRLTP